MLDKQYLLCYTEYSQETKHNNPSGLLVTSDSNKIEKYILYYF